MDRNEGLVVTGGKAEAWIALALLVILLPNVASAKTVGSDKAVPSSKAALNSTEQPATSACRTSGDQEPRLNVYCGGQSNAVDVDGEVMDRREHQPLTGLAVAIIQSLTTLLSSLAWPAALIVIVHYLRREIAALLARLKRGKWGSAEFEFAERASELDAEIEIPVGAEGVAATPDATDGILANPRSAVLEAWLRVESALTGLIQARQLAPDYDRIAKRPLTGIRLVQKAELLAPEYIALFNELRAMRNDAAHAPDFDPPREAVLKYVRFANSLTAELQRLATGVA
jgi:hypothetical protein